MGKNLSQLGNWNCLLVIFRDKVVGVDSVPHHHVLGLDLGGKWVGRSAVVADFLRLEIQVELIAFFYQSESFLHHQNLLF